MLEQWVDQGGQKRSKHILAAESFQFLEPKAKSGDVEYDMETDTVSGGGATAIEEIDITEIPF